MIKLIDRIGTVGDYLKSHSMNEQIVSDAIKQNDWFTKQSIEYALEAITDSFLNRESLEKWLANYQRKDLSAVKVGIVMAGNIPLVGFADLLTVLVLGATPYIKPSSKDRVLMEYLCDLLREVGDFEIKKLEDGQDVDLIIATGSNNSNRYFKANYGNKPSLFRGSRASVAILTGKESDTELDLLWSDCFLYFGLGCRNVSHLFVPTGYDFTRLKQVFSLHRIDHPFFTNSYIQNRAVLKMTGAEFLDGNYYLLRKSDDLFAPMAMVHYSTYENRCEVDELLSTNAPMIQCVVSCDHTAFGRAQQPQLLDYADGMDTIEFLQRFVNEESVLKTV